MAVGGVSLRPMDTISWLGARRRLVKRRVAQDCGSPAWAYGLTSDGSCSVLFHRSSTSATPRRPSQRRTTSLQRRSARRGTRS
jgi:hypothetical protein